VAEGNIHRQRVIVETDQHRIEGDMSVPKEGFRSRLSDFVNQRDREFFSLRDAVVTPLQPGPGQERQRFEFMMVSRNHMRLIAPAFSDEKKS
jgi:uncharacterized protein DUF6812